MHAPAIQPSVMEPARRSTVYLLVLRWQRRAALAGAERAVRRLCLRAAFATWAVHACVWPPGLVSSSDEDD